MTTASAGFTLICPCLSCTGDAHVHTALQNGSYPAKKRKRQLPRRSSGTLANAACSWPPLLQGHAADSCSTYPLRAPGTSLVFIYSFQPLPLHRLIPSLGQDFAIDLAAISETLVNPFLQLIMVLPNSHPAFQRISHSL